MQIRAKHIIIIIICKRLCHDTVCVCAFVSVCVLVCSSISVQIYKLGISSHGVTSSTYTILLHLSPASSTVFIFVLISFSSFNSRFPFRLACSPWFFFFSSPQHHLALSAWSPSQAPEQSFLQFCLHPSPSLSPASSHPPFISPVSLPSFTLKLQLMMNEMNLPWAQTWVALWESAQLPPGHSGLILYSWAASTPVHPVLRDSRDPSLT